MNETNQQTREHQQAESKNHSRSGQSRGQTSQLPETDEQDQKNRDNSPEHEAAAQNQQQQSSSESTGEVDIDQAAESSQQQAGQSDEEVEKDNSNNQLQDAIIRLQADIENIRKRHANELAAAHSFGLEKLMRELLPVLDSFEMGLQSTEMDEQNKGLLEGMQLTSKMLVDALEKHKLSVIAPQAEQGEKFNPEHHEAMTIIPRADLEENTVVEVIQKGYSLSGRLLRPARVIVSGK